MFFEKILDPVIFAGIMLPFIGTALGSLCVFFMRGRMSARLRRVLSGFAAGVMVASSVWSLIIPAIDRASHLGGFSFLPATVGIMAGILFLHTADRVAKSLFRNYGRENRSSLLFFAVTLHNLPEGMAVGAALAASLWAEDGITLAAAIALSLGVAIQDFPEGAIISMPLASGGTSQGRAFLLGAASGIVEPLGALITIVAASFTLPTLPYLLCFAAGAMLYVVTEELIPEMHDEGDPITGILSFAVGFCIMMSLDVALG